MDLTLGDTRLIVDACKAEGLLRNQCAYVLATALWETARTMKPVREYGGEAYLRKKKYYPYVGRGYVQLTWKSNYEKASDKLGVDFVKNPALLLFSDYAVPILVIGMRDGWFTGKRLADYITLYRSDYVGARRIINGTDKRNEIAAIAAEYEALLRAEGYGDAPKPVAPAKPRQDAPERDTERGFWETIVAAIMGGLGRSEAGRARNRLSGRLGRIHGLPPPSTQFAASRDDRCNSFPTARVCFPRRRLTPETLPESSVKGKQMTEIIDAKPWFKSLTVLSGLLTVATGLGFAGLAFDPLTGDFNGNVYELAASLTSFLSGAGAIYGRVRARVIVGK